MTEYISVETADGEINEVPIDDDGTLDLQSMTTQFGGGLRYMNEETGHYRLVKIKDGKLLPPPGGWEAVSSYNVVPTQEKRRRLLPSSGTGETCLEKLILIHVCISSQLTGTDNQEPTSAI